jgi:uncharacterized protein YbjT (DUF2867 family)
MPDSRVLVTGASGHVGGRLLEALREQGRPVRALSRDPSRLNGDGIEVAEGDVLDPDALAAALSGIGVAYYLIHSLGGDDYAATDREAATAFASAAAEAGIDRIVYLSGIGRGDLSPHLASRQEVGRILREGPVTTIELRASIVIGAGSASFEGLRALVDLFPVVLVPDWARTPSQPIAVDDVVAYLLEAAGIAADGAAVYEVGGRDRVPYTAILEEYARSSGKTRVISTVPAPAATAALATATKAVQPARLRLLSDLLDSLRIDTSVQDEAAREAFAVEPRGLVESIAGAT